jgi:hypothetical protein
MINLKEATFIIPIGIESNDREINTFITLSYLCKHLNTNIIIYEFDEESKVELILNKIDKGNTSINHIFKKKDQNLFHRTKFLNEMLVLVKTPVVINYDVDILLEPFVYRKCVDKIINGQDLVYPYFWGDSQKRIYYNGRDKIKGSLDLSVLNNDDIDTVRSEYGHCQFFDTNSYKKGGMENELFISYAPEDQERGYRFKTLGYNVEWSDDLVYHIEHTRGENSSSANPMMSHNNNLFKMIKSLNIGSLISYYENIEYIKKYKQ